MKAGNPFGVVGIVLSVSPWNCCLQVLFVYSVVRSFHDHHLVKDLESDLES